MNSQLYETTLNLMSLIHFYKPTKSDNEKINYVIDFSQSLKTHGVRASSEETKLQFCSYAMEAITSVTLATVKSIVKNSKVKNVEPLLDTEEIDFIKGLKFGDTTDKKSQ